MRRAIEYLNDLDIVCVQTLGTYALNQEVETVKRAIEMMKSHRCNRCLFDHRQTEVIAETMEAYERSDRYKEIGLEPQMRIASLLQEITRDLQFYRDAAVTRGWTVEIFDDYDAALAWLKKSDQ
ncbi:hypothetical protein SAMN02745165_02009 [Malonomonas rubra DSM 5091]|uniref:SpoIIAA-like n=1 Tax=Malonomonas rubra DSM 5091 TaxID=1122189 RepID=A0A1M6I4P4_MALRU|nr:hypothetical protein [Malonomonas rubra]SHJ29375.1 hypothetical protein SAMN02745165_02009 [Malonomonas rubra DSM 5091]